MEWSGERTFILMGVAYLIFSGTVLINWGYNIYKTRVAQELAEKLMVHLGLNTHLETHDFKSLKSDMGKLINLHRQAKLSDFVLALTAAHLLRRKFGINPRIFFDEIRALRAEDATQISSKNEELLSTDQLIKNDAMREFSQTKIKFLSERLTQNLHEMLAKSSLRG